MYRSLDDLDGHAELTTRELVVLGAYVTGSTAATLESALGVAPGEIRAYAADLYDRTGVRDRVMLLAWAMQHSDCCLSEPS